MSIKRFGQNKLFIASKTGIETDENTGYEKSVHSVPKEYYFSYMPASSQIDYQIYGTIIENIYVAYIDRKVYEGVFKVGDKAYLINGECSQGDIVANAKNDMQDKYCSNANYRIRSVLPQNMRIKLTFEKIA